MKNKIIAIMGETASGKDSIAKYITKKYGIEQIVSYATRPMRAGEVNGREHIFISTEQMQKLKETETIFAYTKIEDKNNTNVDGYEYCTTIESITKPQSIYIIDPNGVNYMKNDPKIMEQIDLLVIYVYVPYEVRKERASKTRSDFDKFETRSKQEAAQFEKMRNEKNYDILIENINYEDACNAVDTAIQNFI